MKIPLQLVLLFTLPIGAQAKSGQTTEHFDHDPGWESHNNHIQPEIIKPVQQNFDYRDTNIAGKEKGEIGGTIWRSMDRASYAAKIAPKTLHDRRSASGTFAITATSGSSGAFFGWFDSALPGNGRQSNLGFHFAGAGAGARLTLRLVTAANQSCGTKVTGWRVVQKGEKIRPPSIKNDGTRYTWNLDYDPEAADGNGQMTFTIRGNSPTPEEFEGKTFTVALPTGFKDQNTTFDRFGLMNTMKPGNSLVIHLDDLDYDGKTEDFSKDPGWIGVGNHAGSANRQWGGSHDFGFSAQTSHAGGKAGEVGGTLWRSGAYGYYADPVGPLSLDDRLEASGKVVLTVAPPDSGMYFGWFNSADKENAPTQTGNFVGVKVGGPTRVGHYFLPTFTVSEQVRGLPNSGPVPAPGKTYEWSIVYDPAANGGSGAITATLGDESVTHNLRPGQKAKAKDARLDHFGLLSIGPGGQIVKLYLDDLIYTAAP